MAEFQEEHLLEQIRYPADLRALPVDKLEEVCAELRQYIIDVLSNTPGHLGASLGTVELTVALHYVFNTPYDRIVWDVGHQAYGHKILTGGSPSRRYASFMASADSRTRKRANMTPLLPGMPPIPFQPPWVCRPLSPWIMKKTGMSLRSSVTEQ